MSGYAQTYLQGLQHLLPMAVNNRRLTEAEHWHQMQLMRQYAQMQQQGQMQHMNQQRLWLAQQELMRHHGATENNAVEQLKARLQQMLQPHYGTPMEMLNERGDPRTVMMDSRSGNVLDPMTRQIVNQQPQQQQPSQPGQGPAQPNPTFGPQLRRAIPLPIAEKKRLESLGGNMQSLLALAQSFKPEYTNSLGDTMGGIENAVRRFPLTPDAPFEGGASAMPNWWQQYQALQTLPQRHAISGTTLTAREMSEWNKADVSPGRRPEDIIRSLNIRAALLHGATMRAAQSAAPRYGKREIENALGMSMQAQPLNRFPNLDELHQMGSRLTGLGAQERQPLEDIFGSPN